MAEAHIWHVRTAAHVDVLFMMIQAWPVVMRDVLIKNSNFIAFAARNKGFTRFVPADSLLDDVIVRFGELVHTLFERVNIFLSQRMVKIDIVIEAVIHNRTNSHFGVGPQLFDSMT